jgi:hypothetical protein
MKIAMSFVFIILFGIAPCLADQNLEITCISNDGYPDQTVTIKLSNNKLNFSVGGKEIGATIDTTDKRYLFQLENKRSFAMNRDTGSAVMLDHYPFTEYQCRQGLKKLF